MTDLVQALLELVMFPFHQTNSPIFLTIWGVWMFCVSFKCVRALMRLGLRR